MSYINYLKMLGQDTSTAEAAPHKNYAWDGDDLDGYATLWFTEPSLLKFYIWGCSGDDPFNAAATVISTDLGATVRMTECQHYGGGHYSAVCNITYI